jgi:hypothetical protein
MGDDDELGELRGVVLDDSITVKTVKEPPKEPAQPAQEPAPEAT